jgi:ATP-dependent Clp protease ATP-binding subunit ClpC
MEDWQDSAVRVHVLSERASQVISCAEKEAARLQHHLIGTKHLLLGLLSERQGIAVRVLAAHAIEQEKVGALIAFMFRPEPELVQTKGWTYTRRAREMFARAGVEADRTASRDVEPEHLLLALLADRTTSAAGILESMGASADMLRAEILRALLTSDTINQGEEEA